MSAASLRKPRASWRRRSGRARAFGIGGASGSMIGFLVQLNPISHSKHASDAAESPPSISSRATPRSTSQANAPWTKAEDNLLRKGVFLYGPKRWRDVSVLFSPPVSAPSQRRRSPDACNARWRQLTCHDTIASKAKWTPDEDAALKRLAIKYKEQRWSLVASYLQGRNAKQCRERFKNQICASLNHAPWTRAEDDAIIRSQATHGNRWAMVAEKLPGRTDNMVKNRWYSTLERIATSRQELMEAGTTAAKRKRTAVEVTKPVKKVKAGPVAAMRKAKRTWSVLTKRQTKEKETPPTKREVGRKRVIAEVETEADELKVGMEPHELKAETLVSPRGAMVHSPDAVDAAVTPELFGATTDKLAPEDERVTFEDEEEERREDDFAVDEVDQEGDMCDWVPLSIMPGELAGLGSDMEWLDDDAEALEREKAWDELDWAV